MKGDSNVRKKILAMSLNISIYSMTIVILFRLKNAWIWLSGLHILLFLVFWYRQKTRKVRATVENIEKSEDGYYCITWGYINPGRSIIRVRQGESCLLVKKGTALLLTKSIPIVFERGHHRFAIQTIVKENVEIEWVIGNMRTSYVSASVSESTS